MLALAQVDVQETPSKRPQTPICWDVTDRLKRPDIADRKIPGNGERNPDHRSLSILLPQLREALACKIVTHFICLQKQARDGERYEFTGVYRVIYRGLLLRHDGGLPAIGGLGVCALKRR